MAHKGKGSKRWHIQQKRKWFLQQLDNSYEYIPYTLSTYFTVLGWALIRAGHLLEGANTNVNELEYPKFCTVQTHFNQTN